MTDDDDTVLTEGHGTVESTAPSAARRTPQTEAARFAVARALPAQAPPVTDVHLLEFRAPDVPSGSTVRYKARVDLEVSHIPDFDAEWKIRQRVPRQLSPSEILAHEQRRRRAWRRRALITVAGVSLIVLLAGAAGIWALQRL
jgi:hypothetical protein